MTSYEDSAALSLSVSHSEILSMCFRVSSWSLQRTRFCRSVFKAWKICFLRLILANKSCCSFVSVFSSIFLLFWTKSWYWLLNLMYLSKSCRCSITSLRNLVLRLAIPHLLSWYSKFSSESNWSKNSYCLTAQGTTFLIISYLSR